MSSASRGGWPRLGSGALLALLAGGLVAPGPARAGCDHAEVPRADRGTGTAFFEFLPLPGHPSRPRDEDRPRPCVGSICSNTPAVPILPAPSAPPRAEQWGCLTDPPPPVVAPGRAFLGEDGD